MPTDSRSGTGTRTLLSRIRQGSTSALNRLFERQGDSLRRWARGRLPGWARRGTDTVDLVQETLLKTFQRLDRFQHRGKGALQAYLRTSVQNQISDEMRKVVRRRTDAVDDSFRTIAWTGPSPFEATADAEWDARYKAALKVLTENEQQLVVGFFELHYSYEQLALATGRRTAGAARIAVRRAIAKVARKMAGE